MAEAGQPGARVLLADDNRPLLRLLSMHLTELGHEVKCAENATEVLRALRDDSYDVVVADIYMPGNAEFELLRNIQEVAPDLPVIIMTGKPSTATAIEALRAAAVDYLPKPFEPSDLEKALDRALRVGVRRRSLSKLQALALAIAADQGAGSQRPAQPANSPKTPALDDGLLTHLTTREREVIEQLATGMRAPDVAEHLAISQHTVRSHLKSIYRKLNGNSHIELLAKLGVLG